MVVRVITVATGVTTSMFTTVITVLYIVTELQLNNVCAFFPHQLGFVLELVNLWTKLHR